MVNSELLVAGDESYHSSHQVERGVSARNPYDSHPLLFTHQGKTLKHPTPHHPHNYR